MAWERNPILGAHVPRIGTGTSNGDAAKIAARRLRTNRESGTERDLRLEADAILKIARTATRDAERKQRRLEAARLKALTRFDLTRDNGDRRVPMREK